MPGHPDAALAAGLVRDAIAFDRLPWIRPLVHAYTHDFASIASLFAGDPAVPQAWAETTARVRRAPRDRTSLAALVGAQLARRGAPAPAVGAAERLADPATVAVVTGQQAGLFGGPLYTLLKAVSAIQLARRLEREQQIPAVAVFWVDADDHDWNEVSTAQLLDKDGAPAPVHLTASGRSGHQPVGRLPLGADITEAIETVERTLPASEFTADLVATLRRCYRPGVDLARALASWMDHLLGPLGLIVYESDDVAAKALAAPLFDAELAHPGRTAALARDAAVAMAALGHAPQVEPSEDLVAVFRVDDEGRQAMRVRGDGCAVADSLHSWRDLRVEAQGNPSCFSPNVLLRPLVQDTLFPTVCYVAGPSELAYHAQLGPVYAAFGVERPLVASRLSATLLDSSTLRFLDRYDLPFEALHSQDESALNRLLETLLPPAVARIFEDTDRLTREQIDRLRTEVAAVDSTLVGAVDTTAGRIGDTLHSLHNKIVQAAKKKDATLRRQFLRARHLAFPGGVPQERMLAVAAFINRYGPDLPERLATGLPAEATRHYLATP